MRVKSIISILIIALISFCSVSSVLAAGIGTIGQTDTKLVDDSNVATTAKTIMNVIRIIAVAAAIILLLMLAIKYMSAAPSEKADVKKSAVIYVIGAVMAFGASGILTIIMNASNSLTN